jgi:hypothetical protein
MQVKEPKEREILSVVPYDYRPHPDTWGVRITYKTLDGWEFTKYFQHVDELGAVAKLLKHFAALDRRREKRRSNRT